MVQLGQRWSEVYMDHNRPSGEVRIRAWREGPEVFLEVADEGFGIPEDELPRIFERFYRVEKARTRSGGGTGLGLAIARHAVESRGLPSAESRVGSGSTFTIRLPVGVSKKDANVTDDVSSNRETG